MGLGADLVGVVGHGRKLNRAAAGALILLVLFLHGAPAAPAPDSQRFPNIVILTVDTLRLDRVSAYGYRRPTTPNLDRLLASGVRFTQARTAEPLTSPAVCSMLTSLYPHEHGATRNGLRLRPDAPSVAGLLGRRGYTTAAFVGNWTLRDDLSGLGSHFQEYHEVLTRKRWLGLFKGEATAEDLTDEALAWLARRDPASRRPFLLWVHYVDPHAPYRLQEPFAARLGIATAGEVARSDRYDTEVAFADHHAGRLLAALAADRTLAANTIIVFAADHGESLGEHGEWGHGRSLPEQTLRIPLGLAWPGRIRPGVVSAAAINLDVAPTLLGLAGLPVPESFHGFDWSPVLRGEAEPPRERVLWFQAHKGAVLSAREAAGARRTGLLEVGVLFWPESRKEILRVREGRRAVFDLDTDPGEGRNLAAAGSFPSGRIQAWLTALRRGLAASDRLAAAPIDRESAQKLRSLGYAE
jgi:arylsulfatase A-like enzyme